MDRPSDIVVHRPSALDISPVLKEVPADLRLGMTVQMDGGVDFLLTRLIRDSSVATQLLRTVRGDWEQHEGPYRGAGNLLAHTQVWHSPGPPNHLPCHCGSGAWRKDGVGVCGPRDGDVS